MPSMVAVMVMRLAGALPLMAELAVVVVSGAVKLREGAAVQPEGAEMDPELAGKTCQSKE